jgi:glutamate--cysteine ligase
LGNRGSGESMMSSTAALQVNLDAGPRSGWERRLALVRAMTPVLVALSATSPYLAGRSSGWHSMRQGCWNGIDRGRSDPFASGEPTAAWADYALSAPVMLVRDPGPPHPPGTMLGVTERVSFAHWLQGRGPVRRPPTTDDLDYHLTTLFPPVRPRGYLEIRCIDALPDRWAGAVASLVATLVDDPVAADHALEVCAPVEGAWELAARDGLEHREVRRAVQACLELALEHGPVELRPEVQRLTDLVASGSSPGQEIRERVEAVGPLAVLEEEARA